MLKFVTITRYYSISEENKFESDLKKIANVILENIAIDITSEQISKCSKVIDLQTDEDFYQVESSTGECDYEVRYDAEKGLTCTCEAGQHGFWNCRNYRSEERRVGKERRHRGSQHHE